MNKKAIGIIGGMGPQASQYFYGLLIRHAQKDFGATKNNDFPEIYLASVPVPDFINSQKRQAKALKMLKERVKQMDKLPIAFFCLACNTAHLLLKDLKKQTDKPFVSLLEELPRFLQEKRIKRPGLLATPTVIRTKMYQKILEDNGIEIIVSNKEDEKLLGKIIIETVAGENLEENRILIQDIARRLLERGAQAIIESCTEIPLIFPKQHLVPVFDTLEILALAVLKRYYLLK